MLWRSGFFWIVSCVSLNVNAVVWDTNINLGQGAGVPSVAMDGANAIGAWYGSPIQTLQVAHTIDGGKTWSGVTIPSETNAQEPIVAMQGNHALIVWGRGTDHLYYASYSQDFGATWSLPQNISSVLYDTSYEFAVALDGNIAIATWLTNSRIVQARVSQDFGLTWGPILDLSGVLTGTPIPKVALQGNHAIVIWYDNQFANISITSDGGNSWSSPTVISATGISEPQIALYGTNAIALWIRHVGADYFIESTTSSDAGNSWSSPIPISLPSTSISDPPNVQLKTNYAQAAWSAQIGADFIVQTATSQNSGTTWSLPVNLSPVGHVAHYQASGLSEDGKNGAVSWSLANTLDQAATTEDFGITWSTPVNIIQNVNNVLYNAMALSGNRAVAIAFTTPPLSTTQMRAGVCNFQQPLVLSYNKTTSNMLFEKNRVNQLFWNAIPSAVAYKVYMDAALTQNIYNGKTALFNDHNVSATGTKTYYVTWVDVNGLESPPSVIVISQ